MNAVTVLKALMMGIQVELPILGENWIAALDVDNNIALKMNGQWHAIDMPLKAFIDRCEALTEDRIVNIRMNIALNETKAEPFK